MYISFIKIYGYLINKLLNNTEYNEKLINHILTSYSNRKLDNNIFELINNFNLISPNYIINHSMNNYLNKNEISISTPVSNIISEPLVYLYNSHQSESYASSSYNAYNIKMSVLTASYLMSEKFNALGVNTIVEENNITELLRSNNWKYSYSYVASRLLLEDIILKQPTLNYFIDIHRDSGSHEKTTAEYDNKSYAKLLFVVGMEHDNHEKNLNLTTKLNDLIIKHYPFISRGISKKEGPGVNGKYNQDFHENTLLLEIGGENNNFEEVYNTIDLISPLIIDVIKEMESES